MRALMMLSFCLLLGCGEAPTLTQGAMEELSEGMTIKEVQGVIGSDNRTLLSTGSQEALQWEEGEGDSLASITVRFEGGKLVQKIGTNLPQ